MSSIGSFVDGEDPGNQPDGSYYNLFPVSPQPGLFGGQFADIQANAPGMTRVDAAALGLDSDFSNDGTGLPPSVTVVPNLPQIQDSIPAGQASIGLMPASDGTTAGDPDAVMQYNLPGVGQTYLDPEFARRLDDFRSRAKADNIPLTFSAGYRTQDYQNDLRNDHKAITPAMHSLHSTGDAVDIPFVSNLDQRPETSWWPTPTRRA